MIVGGKKIQERITHKHTHTHTHTHTQLELKNKNFELTKKENTYTHTDELKERMSFLSPESETWKIKYKKHLKA